MQVRLTLNLNLFHKVTLFLALFWFFFPFRIPGIPISTEQLVGVYALGYVIWHRMVLPDWVISYIKWITFIIICSLISLICSPNPDAQPIKLVIIWILYPFIALYIREVITKIYHKCNIEICFKWVIIVFVTQAIISLIIFVVPPIKEIVIPLVTSDDSSTIKSVMGFRLIAIAKPEMQFANMAVAYGIATYIVYVRSKLVKMNQIWFASLILLFSIAGLLSGRSYAIMMALMIGMIAILKCNKGIGVGFKYILKISCIIGIAVAILIAWLLANGYEETYKWAFEIFINYQESGKMDMASADVMKSMYKFPDNPITWLIGDGRLGNESGGSYMHTDIGYIRYLFCWGILGSLMVYLSQLSLFYNTFKLVSSRYVKSLAIFIIVWAFIYLSKEIYNCYCPLCLIAACGQTEPVTYLSKKHLILKRKHGILHNKV